MPTEPTPKKKRTPRPEGEAKVSRLQKPAGMSLEDWQVQLRKQFGRDQAYVLKNKGDRKAFSDFLVTNPESRRTYRVTVRGTLPGEIDTEHYYWTQASRAGRRRWS